MNDQRPAAARMEESAPRSPKRKKVRAKYAPKACVSCRRSKLKCSGENPCQRCVDNGKRCFYSEDQTAAEALQNLSRPPTTLATTYGANGNGNGHGRRSAMQQHHNMERRESDTSVLGMSMEARMARIEGMMESLIQERGATATPAATMEHDEAVADDILSLRLAQVNARRPSSRLESPESTRQSASLTNGADSPAALRLGPNNVPFPQPADYQRYLDFFFADLGAYYPCVNEADFRIRSEQMLTRGSVHSNEVCLLALHYVVFACSDMATTSFVGDPGIKPPGWQWFQAASDIAASREISGRGDLSLIQYLILKAVYLSFADLADAAYNVIGLACRLCFQFGLNQQSSWRSYTPFDIHMRQRVFWTAYFLDRQISLSCGHPYCIRESAIGIELPAYLSDRDIHPDQPLPEPDFSTSSNVYLNAMACWGRLAAEVWDGLFDAAVMKIAFNKEHAAQLDAQVLHWSNDVLPTIPLVPHDQLPSINQQRQSIITHTRLTLLRLYISRQAMTMLQYDETQGRASGDLALDLVHRICDHSSAEGPLSSFRFYMATALGSAMLVFSTLVHRHLAQIGLQDRQKAYMDGFGQAREMLEQLAQHTHVARRILSGFEAFSLPESTFAHGPTDPASLPEQPVPSNLSDLLPVAPELSQHSGGGGSLDVETDSTEDWDLWDFSAQKREGKYGMVWM